MTTHTPGPWTFEAGPDYGPGIQRQGYVQRPHGHSIETNIADARLIAEAPAMLEVIQRIAGFALGGIDDPLIHDARALLARVEGR